MPNSLKNQIKKLYHDGDIPEEKYQKLINKLEGHDRQIKSEAIEDFIKYCEKNMPYDICDGHQAIEEMWDIAKEYKEEES